MTEFVHLHVHTHYSLLDSTVKVPALVKRVAELGMDAVAMTDHGNMFGAIELQEKCAGSGVRPIFGAAVNVVAERDPAGRRARPHQLVLLAENLDGYRNLVRLVSRGWVAGLDHAGRPIVTHEELESYAAGLICLTGDIGGEIPHALLRGDAEAALAALHRYWATFGRDNVYIELQRADGVPEFQDATTLLVEFADEHGVPVVATNNVHYLHAGDHEAHAVLMCIGMDKRVDRGIIGKIPLRSLYVASPQEMEARFADVPEAIANTRVIADRCDVTIPTGMNYLPDFPVPEGSDAASYLAELAEAGLEDRLAALDRAGTPYDRAVYTERLRSEVATIVEMGFPGYFLIVWDFIKWSRDNGIPVGPGRGSGAGSLVAYSLGITDIDPMIYGLLFERFLNPERVSMPDFDIDFCQNRRGEVLRYVAERYGEENVGQIVTFGQLKAKAAIRDVARVLNLSYGDADRIAKLVPDELNITLKDAFDREPRLREEINKSDTNAYLYESAIALEGNNRNTGMHAAGIVISGKPLWEYVPVSVGAHGEYVTQFAKNEVEAAGLVKFDFLGLKTLTVVDDAVAIINRGRPADDLFDLATIPLDAPEVYELIGNGDTVGVFQMESQGFQNMARSLKADCFEDLVAAVALYRPGPLNSGMVEQFIACKHGRKDVSYPHPWLESTLKETYGVMVYQEQVMEVARVLAGFTLGGADLLRRAMGKKKQEEMDKQRALFVSGATDKGVAEGKANEVFDLMAYFAGYGFNKSHSAAYALIAYQTAYLKAYHPTAFYAAAMTNDAGSTNKVVRYIHDARARGIRVLPPDVSHSEHSFSVSDGEIRFGLGAVKGLGAGAVEAIIEARTSGPFGSLYDFCERVDSRRCNRRAVETLVRCGALDSTFVEEAGEDAHTVAGLGRWRARLFAAVEAAVERGAKAQRDKEAGQADLFGLFAAAPSAAAPAASYPKVRGWSEAFTLEAEKKLLGFYVSGHPLDRYRDEIARYSDCDSSRLGSRAPRDEVVLAGVIASKQEKPVRKGEGRNAFLVFEDLFGECEVVVYASTYAEVQDVLDSDEPLLIHGRVRIDGDGDERTWKVVAGRVKPLSAVRSERVREVRIEVQASWLGEENLSSLSSIVSRHPGTSALGMQVNFPAATATYRIGLEGGVSPSDDLVHDLGELIGERSIRFR